MYEAVPRKVLAKLEKVVSTKIFANQFDELLVYARDFYLKKIIPQPTVSALASLHYSTLSGWRIGKSCCRKDIA